MIQMSVLKNLFSNHKVSWKDAVNSRAAIKYPKFYWMFRFFGMRKMVRLDSLDLPIPQREIIELPYKFLVPKIERIFGSHRDFFRNLPVPSYSNGNQYIRLFDTKTIGGTSFYLHRDGATLIGLDSESEGFIKSYILGSSVVWDKKYFYISQIPKPTIQLEIAISLHGENMNEWGHVTQDLQFRALTTMNLPWNIPVLLPSNLPKNARKLMEQIIGNREIIEIQDLSCVSVKELLVPLPRTRTIPGWKSNLDPLASGWAWQFDGPAVQRMQELITKHQVSTKRSRRIFLSRQGFKNRKLINEDEVRNLCTTFNFEIVEPQNLEIQQMTQILNESLVVLTTLGSQVNNLIFCLPGLKVISIGSSDENRLGYSTALFYAGHHEIRVISEKLNDHAENPHEYKQAPQRVSIERLTAAIEDTLQMT